MLIRSGNVTDVSMADADHDVERTCREINVNDSILRIYEHTDLDNEAGAVVWDAALVLLHYFCKGKLPLESA